MKDLMLPQGYDKEAYEYSISPRYLARKKKAQRAVALNPSSTYLVKLEGLLKDAKAVQELARLDTVPRIERDANTLAMFCTVTGDSRDRIIKALAEKEELLFKPTFVCVSRAAKELSSDTIYPTLGIDTTLPQFRSNGSKDMTPSPHQDEYPVLYFFYGTLADTERLGRILSCRADSISLRDARVSGGRLTTWAGKYTGLLNAENESARVPGWVYQVQNKDDENSLRLHMTEKYEVVRCTIEIPNDGCTAGAGKNRCRTVQGLTFRLARG